jgi:hypothetical protein
LRILSQKVASNSALVLPATPLLQKISKASLSAYWTKAQNLLDNKLTQHSNFEAIL